MGALPHTKTEWYELGTNWSPICCDNPEVMQPGFKARELIGLVHSKAQMNKTCHGVKQQEAL